MRWAHPQQACSLLVVRFLRVHAEKMGEERWLVFCQSLENNKKVPDSAPHTQPAMFTFHITFF